MHSRIVRFVALIGATLLLAGCNADRSVGTSGAGLGTGVGHITQGFGPAWRR